MPKPMQLQSLNIQKDVQPPTEHLPFVMVTAYEPPESKLYVKKEKVVVIP